MGTSWIFIAFLIHFTCYAYCEDNVGPGIWNIIHISPCPMGDSYEIQTNMTRKKIGRGVDGFDGCIFMGLNLTLDMAIRMEVCKEVEGGCKPFFLYTCDSFCTFMDETMPTLFKMLLEGWKLEPAECPVQEGEYCVSSFPFDYSSLFEEAIYGVFEAIIYAFNGPKEVMCLKVVTSFTKKEDDEDED
ncbi:uncharacterized protein LOC128682859 [Plodia interpunctella]|uniref:uncharacterized protein LOC128682859 n=1 Tax=Plodia interpunctella TaxID=58824 RepID=UPI002367FAD0|nr:uncharacterized protein LOC128682859 [Plodia interpunctella]